MAVDSFRHENKYVINYMQYKTLRTVVKGVLQPDKHADKDGNYLIRSLYYDSPYNNTVLDKEFGVHKRAKIRIRTYGNENKLFFLEKKIKNDDSIAKQRAKLDLETYKNIINGKFNITGKNIHLDELQLYIKNQLLKPAVIVEYTKEVYVHPASTLRITFDKDIRSCMNCKDLLDPNPIKMRVLPDDYLIMEVKYNYYLPDFVRMLVSALNIEREGISKFELCLNTVRPLNKL